MTPEIMLLEIEQCSKYHVPLPPAAAIAILAKIRAGEALLTALNKLIHLDSKGDLLKAYWEYHEAGRY